MSSIDYEKQSLILSAPVSDAKSKYVLVIHGGAGTMNRRDATPEQRIAYHTALRQALFAGYDILREGGEALDAVATAVSTMEDNPLFNSGKGAVFNNQGAIELETSVMLSKPPVAYGYIPETRRGLSVTLITRAKNPSKLVRALYLHPELVPHPMVSGMTAEDIGAGLGIELVDPSYFYTEKRWREHRRGLGLPEEPLPFPEDGGEIPVPLDQLPTGTVGAVALDVRGCIATLTSTGGRTNKLVGRIGDTPVMGAGFWAEEWTNERWFSRPKPKAVGISGTGDGDYFIRLNTAATLTHRMKLKKESLKKASKNVIEALQRENGIGGLISVDIKGNVSTPLNSSGMYRGLIRQNGKPKTAIFDDERLE